MLYGFDFFAVKTLFIAALFGYPGNQTGIQVSNGVIARKTGAEYTSLLLGVQDTTQSRKYEQSVVSRKYGNKELFFVRSSYQVTTNEHILEYLLYSFQFCCLRRKHIGGKCCT
jgi:hypothetical protein